MDHRATSTPLARMPSQKRDLRIQHITQTDVLKLRNAPLTETAPFL